MQRIQLYIVQQKLMVIFDLISFFFHSFYLFVLDTIRFLSLHDNKYIRYFPGHVRKYVFEKRKKDTKRFVQYIFVE